MIPDWVTDDLELLRWIETVLTSCGAVPEDHVHTETEEVVDLDGTRRVIVEVEPTRLTFYGEQGVTAVLDFAMSFEVVHDVDGQFVALNQIDYGFHLRTQSRNIVWRLDKHAGHPMRTGDCHIHRGSEQNRRPFGEVDLAEAIAHAWVFVEDGSTP